MTSQTDARERIYQAFVTGWGNRTPITLENERYSPALDTAWVRLTVRHQIGVQESLGSVGNRRFLRAGIIFLQIFTPLEAGMRAADGHVDFARGVLEGVTLTTGIRLYGASSQEIGAEDGWYQVNLEVSFEYEEVK